MKLNRSKKGFTLVEIMIVVVIIGLLAAMAIPALEKVRSNSAAKAMANDARQIGSAMQQIYGTYNLPMDTVFTMTYDPSSGVVDNVATTYTIGGATVIVPASEVQKYFKAISKGYVTSAGPNAVGPIVYTTTLASTETAARADDGAFSLTHQRVSPNLLTSGIQGLPYGNSITLKNNPVTFDAEGRVIESL
jgi:type IV pilus assembly protein PilA